MKIDQLTIGNLSSYDDFEANVKERSIGAPKKKVIKETVPFSNEVYDFSAINGEVYWEERPLEYVFEILADSPEELEEKKQEFANWIMNVMEEDIHDPFITDYHFRGTFSDIDFDDSEIEKSTITVSFTAYPYKISDVKRICTFAVDVAEQTIAKINNNSSHRIVPTFVSDVPFTVQYNGSTYSFSAGENKNYGLMLGTGITSLILQSTSGSGKVKVEFYEEVF